MVIEGDAGNFADICQVRNVVSRDCVRGEKRLHPVVADEERHGADISVEALDESCRGLGGSYAIECVKAAVEGVNQDGLAVGGDEGFARPSLFLARTGRKDKSI